MLQKLYCYVDETGQDTQGKFFIVAIIIAQEDRNLLVELVEGMEQSTGKKATKWQKTAKPIKQRYIEQVLQTKHFHGKLFYAHYENTTAYQELTVLTLAAAIHKVTRQEKYKASVFIDGLPKSQIAVVSASLRKIGIRTEKVRGARDESHALIRLADALAGFIREYEEGREYASALFEVGVSNKTLTKL